MKTTFCENCQKPCVVIDGYEHVPDEFGMQRHRIDISECCCAEVYEEDVPDEEEENEE